MTYEHSFREIRWGPHEKLYGNKSMKLHLGAFNYPVEGWINTDITPHQWMYTKESLVHLLQKNGFSNVKACSFREGKCEDLDRINNCPENSIYVDGENA